MFSIIKYETNLNGTHAHIEQIQGDGHAGRSKSVIQIYIHYMLNKHLKEFFEMAQIKNEVLMYKELLFLQLEKKTSIHKKIKESSPG